MKLVIDISEKLYEDIKYNFEKKYYCDCGGYLISSTIVNGTPFEKELENIKEEIKQYTLENKNSEDLDLWSVWRDGAYYSLSIIDRYIEELKGE